MRSWPLKIILLIFLLTGCFVCLPVSAQTNGSLYLTVSIKDPYNPDFRFCTPVEPARRVRVGWRNGKVKNKISFVILPPVNDEYSLNIAVSEFESEQSNLKESSPDIKLKLEKPFAWGMVSGFVYMREAVLSTRECTELPDGTIRVQRK